MRSPVPDFVDAFRQHRTEVLERMLHEEVVYRVKGFDPVAGRRAVLAYWRRMFECHDAIRMSLERHVHDVDLVVTSQRQAYVRSNRAPLIIDSIVIYELEQGHIAAWSDNLNPDTLPADDIDLWRRLRTARW